MAIKNGQQVLAIPAYFYPAGANLAYWDQLRSGFPSVRIAIATGLGLEGNQPNSDYQAQITKTRKVGIQMLAYVTTSNGSKPLAQAQREIDNAYAWYAPDGIFFDEAVAYPVTAAQVGYYQTLYRYVKRKGGARRGLTVINHGQILPEEYAPVCDIMMNAEMSYDSYVKGEWKPWGWESRYPPTKFWHLIHGVDTIARMREVLRLSRARNAHYIFVTPATMNSPSGPWGALPPDSYWRAEMKEITTPTLLRRGAKDARG
jgi:hypothetical protein